MPDMLDLRQVPTREKMSKKKGRSQLLDLQAQLLRYQQATYKHGHRIVLVFEGADAGGKGGAIKRVTQMLDPRGFSVYPIGPPTQEELQQHYLQRFWRRFPVAGEMTIFDRSWYGRVLVERVDELTPEAGWQRAYSEINDLERWLVDDGVIMLKFFMHISAEEQKQRLLERMRNPAKRWKVTSADLDAHEQWESYTDAWNDMLRLTNTSLSPWFVIPADNKHAARVSVLRWLVAMLGESLKMYGQKLNPELVQRAERLFGESIADDDGE
jgi:polyphosphate kinase 2 (PPK2 family)